MIYAKIDREVQLYSLDLLTLNSDFLLSTGPVSQSLYFDVALGCERLAAVFNNAAWIADIGGTPKWERVYTPPRGCQLQDLPSITMNGLKLLIGESDLESHSAIEIDLRTGESEVLFRKRWHANHFHYCPFDEAWIGFSHEGPTETTPDRCWVWHAEKAPEGKVVFDQTSSLTGVPLCVGHERWAFHDVSAYVIAYAVSPGGKRGLYEAFADSRQARLIWESDVAWHVDMDLTGRFAVLDTSGSWFAQGAKEIDKAREEHLLADKLRTANRSDIVLLDLQEKRSLYIATVERTRHPWHPHPALSLNNDFVVFNDYSNGNRGFWIYDLDLG